MNRFLIVAVAAILAASPVQAVDFEPATMTVLTSSILDSHLLKGEHYTIAESVTVSGYMNHYTIDSEFGQFIAVGDRKLKKLLREIDAIAQLRTMTSLSIGTDAAIDAVADTGKSVANLIINPVESAKGMSAGVSRFFKRTSRTAKNVSSEVTESITENDSGDDDGGDGDNGDGADNDSEEEDSPDLTTQLASSYMGIGKAHRELARELEVDPYSDNVILQAELNRVAEISGSVRKITKLLIPIPSFVGATASVNDMVWSLSPLDLLIQNEEKLKALGYTDELIMAFFSSKFFSPTGQTVLVAAMESLDKTKGREVLLNIAILVESQTESEFVLRATLFTQLYHESIEPVIELISFPDGLVSVAITGSGDGMIFAPVDQLLWTEEIAMGLESLAKLIDDHGATDESLIWVDGRVSDMALAQLSATGWVDSTEGFQKLEAMTRD